MNHKLGSLFRDSDVLFLLGLLGISLYFLVDSLKLNPMVGSFPKWVSLLSVVLIVYTLVGKYAAMARTSSREQAVGVAPETAIADAEPPEPSLDTSPAVETVKTESRVLPWYILLAITIAYVVALVPLLGFTFSTLIYMVIVPKLMGLSWPKAALFGVVTTVALVGLFQYVFNVPMPTALILRLVGM